VGINNFTDISNYLIAFLFLFRTLLSVIPHLMRNPEVYSKKKLEFSIETFRHGNHLVILRERSCQQLKYLFFFIFIILVKNWSGFPIKDFGNDISVVIQSDCRNPGSICCYSGLDTGSKVYSLSFGIKEEERNLDPQSSWG